MSLEIINTLKKMLKGIDTLRGVLYNHHARHQQDGTDDLESLLKLANFSEKAHSSLTGVTASQHHAKTTSPEIDHGSVQGLGDDDHPQYNIPAGVIVMWSGTLATIPDGWALCDGDDGRPDLRDRFIRGTSDGVDPGGTGGSDTHTHAAGTLSADSAGAHTHPSAGSHTHSVNPPKTTSGYETLHYDPSGHHALPGDYWATHDVDIPPFTSGSGGTHTHTSAGAHPHTISGSVASSDNKPAYYALAFIMKI